MTDRNKKNNGSGGGGANYISNHEGANNTNPDDGVTEEQEQQLCEFVVELFWLASFNKEDMVKSARSRIQILEFMKIVLAQDDQIEHHAIFHLLQCSCGINLTFLRSQFMHNFIVAVNAQNEGGEYAQRARLANIIDGLLRDARPIEQGGRFPIRVHGDDNTGGQYSDITAHEGEDTARSIAEQGDNLGPRMLSHGVPAFENLAELGDALGQAQGVARMPSESSSVGLALSENSGDTVDILEKFKRGKFDALKSMGVERLLRILSTNRGVLINLLIVPKPDDVAVACDDPQNAETDDAVEGNIDDFSHPGGGDVRNQESNDDDQKLPAKK